MEENNMSVAENIRKIRKERGFSQEKIADILRTTQQQYSRYEKGENELPIRHLITLCNFYEVSADRLLGLDCE